MVASHQDLEEVRQELAGFIREVTESVTQLAVLLDRLEARVRAVAQDLEEHEMEDPD